MEVFFMALFITEVETFMAEAAAGADLRAEADFMAEAAFTEPVLLRWEAFFMTEMDMVEV